MLEPKLHPLSVGRINEGVYQVREQVRFVPDRNLLLIVETIEEVGTGSLRLARTWRPL